MNLEELKEKYFGTTSSQNHIINDVVFDEWNLQKKKLHKILEYPRTKRRQVWWCVVGQNIGQEQSCSVGYERPVLVVKAFGGLFWGLPITSSDPEGKKALNPLYFKIEGIKYLNEDGVDKFLHGFVALHQLRVFDGRRLKRKLLKLDETMFQTITNKLSSYLK
jgi:hypothetical protein